MKRALSIIGIGAAFGAVSLWVWLTRGKNAKAVKAKFRLGGALLTLTSALSLVPLPCRLGAALRHLRQGGSGYGRLLIVSNILEKCQITGRHKKTARDYRPARSLLVIPVR